MLNCPHCGASIVNVWDDPNCALILRDGKRLKFGAQEWVILRVLRHDIGKLVTHEQLLDAMYAGVRGNGPASASKVMAVAVSKVRNKLRDTGWRIATYRGEGYRLEGPSDAS